MGGHSTAARTPFTRSSARPMVNQWDVRMADPPRHPPGTSASCARRCIFIFEHMVLQWQVQQQCSIGGYHFFLAPHSTRAWFELAFAAQVPFLEAALHRATLSQHACNIALLFAELCAEHVDQLF